MELTKTIAVVKEYGIEMTSKMIAILQSKNSQNLYNEINQDMKSDMEAIILEIKMPEYGYYASEGRNPGRFPPPESIEKWMDERGIDLALLYPIGRSIATFGTKASASHFLNEFRITQLFEDNLMKAYAKDIVRILTEKLHNVSQV